MNNPIIMKQICIIIALIPTLGVFSQDTLTLQKTQFLAGSHFPLLPQKKLAETTAILAQHNFTTAFWPQINLSGQATYQSAVTALPIKIPSVQIETLNKDQYRALVDVNQLIYDGGINKTQKEIVIWQQKTAQTQVDVALQKLQESINELFIGMLSITEQLKQVTIVNSDLQLGIDKINAQLKNGTAFRASLALLQAEQLKNEQRKIELVEQKNGLAAILSIYTGIQINGNTFLQWPQITNESNPFIQRSELALYNYRDTLLQQQKLLVDAKMRPKINAFVQSGYGRPGLNLLNNEFEPFAIMGVRLNWNISALYNRKREIQGVQVQQAMLQAQHEQFMQQLQTQISKHQTDIKKYQLLLAQDEKIIGLRTTVKQAAQAQLEQGIITSSDYIREVNNEDLARLQALLHQLQLVQALVGLQTTLGHSIQ